MTGRVDICLRIFVAYFIWLLSSKISQLETLKLLEGLVFTSSSILFSFQLLTGEPSMDWTMRDQPRYKRYRYKKLDPTAKCWFNTKNDVSQYIDVRNLVMMQGMARGFV